MPAATFRLLLALTGLLALCLAQAQGVRIDAPADRLVGPGEFVTLIFRLDSPAGIEVEAEARSDLGWRILRQPGALTLEPGRSQPLALTVEVPADAEASLTDTVTLVVASAGARAEARATLTVAEVVAFDLQLPETVLLETGGFDATVVNRGNVALALELEVRREGETLTRVALTLGPGETRSERLDVPDEGFYEVRLLGGSRQLSRTIRALRFGVAGPPPLQLTAEVSAELDSLGSWGVALALEGALSDFVAIDARLDSNLERSFLALGDDARRFILHLGSGPPRPFRLPVPDEPGIALGSESDPWATALAVGWADDGGAAGYLAVRYGSERGEVALAGGYAERAPFAAARGRLQLPEDRPFAVTLEAAFDLRNQRLNANASLEARRLEDRAQVRLELLLREGFGDRPRLELLGRTSDDLGSLYGDLVVALAPDAEGSWRLGGDLTVPSALPGRLQALLQVGRPTSFALGRYTTQLGGGWRSQTSAGVLSDDQSFGVRLASAWSYGSGPGNDVRLGADLIYWPALDRVDGRVDARWQREIDALELLASANWDLQAAALGAGASAHWRGGAWQLQFDLDAGYHYDGAAEPFRLEASLKGSYAFAFEPAPALSRLAGGRNLGRLEGRIVAGDRPLAGVEVGIGPFRLISDATGHFEAELEPGSYRVRLAAATLPANVRLFGPSELAVEVPLGDTVLIGFDVRETASLQGRVLEDRDGDGVADLPEVGVRARLLLLEADGVVRALASDADGSFRARGIAPGTVELRLIEQPFGSVSVGPAVLSFEAAPGERLEATFLSRPAQAAAQTFGGGLRLARIDVVPQTAPPGAAPLLLVSVRGAPERVFVEGPQGTVELEPVGESWIGRYPLADDAGAGVVPVRVVASAGERRSERQARLLVDPEAPPFEVAVGSPVAPGADLVIEADVYLAATSVRASAAGAGSAALTETEAGRWSGLLTVPADAADGVYDLEFEVIRGDGRSFDATLRFRVRVPDSGE